MDNVAEQNGAVGRLCVLKFGSSVLAEEAIRSALDDLETRRLGKA